MEELKIGESLIKHKVMCIFPLGFKKHKNAIQILGDALASFKHFQTFATGLYLLLKILLPSICENTSICKLYEG